MSALPAASPVVVELRGIKKRYRATTVLDGLNLDVRRGEIVGLLGPNGSGKTTSLRIAAGYLWPDAGHVQLNDKPLTPRHAALRSGIGYLPERVPLYDPFRVERYLRFVASARGLHGAARDEAVEESLRACDLTAVRRRVIGQLSKGYRQRIGLAQAVLTRPDLLLLDEPTNGLDPFQIIEARALIKRCAEQRAVIFSTHILQEVEALCTRVVYLNHGRLVELPPARTESVLQLEISTANPQAVQELLVAQLDSATDFALEQKDTARYQFELPAPISGGSALLGKLVALGEVHRFGPAPDSLERRLARALAEHHIEAPR